MTYPEMDTLDLHYCIYDITRTSGAYDPLVLAPVEGLGGLAGPQLR